MPVALQRTTPESLLDKRVYPIPVGILWCCLLARSQKRGERMPFLRKLALDHKVTTKELLNLFRSDVFQPRQIKREEESERFKLLLNKMNV